MARLKPLFVAAVFVAIVAVSVITPQRESSLSYEYVEALEARITALEEDCEKT